MVGTFGNLAQPQGFIDLSQPHLAFKLQKAIYVLTLASQVWYHKLHQFFVTSSFNNSYAKNCLSLTMAILQCIFWLMLMTFIIDLLSLTLLSVISLLVPSSIYYLHALTFHIHCVSCLSLCINLLVTT